MKPKVRYKVRFVLYIEGIIIGFVHGAVFTYAYCVVKRNKKQK